MTKFLYSLSVIIFYISNYIECSKLYDALQSYYKNHPHENFENAWQLYHKAFATEIASNLKGNFGRKAVNIYEPGRRDAHLIAGGFYLTDGVVMVYFFEMMLRELPSLLRPQLDMGLSTNRVKFNSKVDQMFIDTTYYVARNSSSVIYARPEDQKELSPFSLQQVDNSGRVAIVVEDCTLSGISIATLSGDSVNLGHNTFMLSDCKFTVEISTPNSGAPPVIAPYFPTGPSTYQYKQAISYLAETLNEDGSLNLEYVKDHSNILKMKVQSRHISRKTYRCFVEYVPNSIGFGSITRHYCECANGMRTVGCCSHIAAIVYYLSYARYLSKIIRPAEMLSRLFLTHGISVTVNEDSDRD